MGLQSALSTALTGMNAAETSIDVVGNNVANANTVGFKESTVNFATQFLQTQSIGSAPTDSRGGTNPRQVGLGVKVAEISPEFTQGTIEISSNPLDMAIQGDGFFIVQGSNGEQFYTRNGQFKTNSDNELVTITGQRVLGYGVDENFEIQPTGLEPIQIPLGQAAIAQPTENVFFEGTLNPEGGIGTIPERIESLILSDGSKEVPADTATTTALTRPAESTTVAAGAPSGSPALGPGTYSYRVAFVDADGNEGPASNVTSNVAVLAGLNNTIDLANIPQPAASSEFQNINIYRLDSDTETEYTLVGSVGVGTTTFNDTATSGTTPLNADGLSNGSYSYYVTFYNSVSGEESRPTARFGPVTADATTSPMVRLDSLPEPSTTDFDGIRIYRNLANDQNSYHLVDQITPTEIAAYGTDVSYIDSTPDSVVSGNPEIDLEGPDISFGLPLVEVVTRDGSNYENLFEVGTLSFTGNKGGRELAQRELEITSTTTVQDLISFMEESMGVVKSANEDSFPSTTNFGGDIVDNRLQFTSNMGIENALSIDLSAFQLTPAGGTASTVPLTFTRTGEPANGLGASADFVVYDSLGSPLSVRITTVLEESTSTEASFRWIATSPDNDPEAGDYSTVVGTGVITTDGEGKFIAASSDTIAIDRRNSPAASPLEFNLDFSQISGLTQADGESELSASRQDGFPAGTLSSFIITETGRIQGVFSNGSSRDLGQIRMARFANNTGLEQIGDNMFAAGVNSGLPIQGDPGGNGIGNVTAGAVELSNTDIGQNLIELILASTQYRGGARVITAVQELLDELLALRR
ncbi:MAG: flagellar biosynthesis protein FlgE [Planctomycetaceae bacterium]|nr:flagellar biosynthesis protein FlgE [Planctomycetaceae bacterium]